MPHYKYLIVGGGMAAAAAVEGLRDVDPQGTLGLIGAEPDPPYKRPPLTKGLWKAKPLASIWRGTESKGVDLHLGRRAATLDPRARQLTDERGTAYTFDTLLLATGGTPRRLPGGGEHIIYFRTVADYRRLRALADQRQRFAVIGGGFIGTELAAALRMNGKDVVLLVRGEDLGGGAFPHDLGQFLVTYYREQGVDVRPGDSVVGVAERSGQVVVQTRSGQDVLVDGVVAGMGIHPNVELAQQAGLAVDDGIVVDEYLRTSHPAIYAAGDVAAFPDAILGQRRRVEHEDNANAMGRLAGRAMAGDAQPYHYLPFFYSDLVDLGYEAVGEVDGRLETVADWHEPYRTGVVYYLRGGRVRGVLLWNVWDQVQAARRLIAEPGPFTAADLQGRLPEP
jgi:NADPH-dependent 2,4-dienoyl-CoA reductase/sulfur reductase-like enzyme